MRLRHYFRRPRARAVVLAMVTLVLGGCQAGPVAPPAAPPSTLQGAWRATIQFTDGALAPAKDLQFLYVFNAGGTLVESSNYDEAPPVPPAYGVWREAGPTRFEAKYVFFMTKQPTKFEEVAGGGGWMPTGHGILTETIHLATDGQSYDSTVLFEAFDLAGKPASGGGKGTAHGTRIGF